MRIVDGVTEYTYAEKRDHIRNAIAIEQKHGLTSYQMGILRVAAASLAKNDTTYGGVVNAHGLISSAIDDLQSKGFLIESNKYIEDERKRLFDRSAELINSARETLCGSIAAWRVVLNILREAEGDVDKVHAMVTRLSPLGYRVVAEFKAALKIEGER